MESAGLKLDGSEIVCGSICYTKRHSLSLEMYRLSIVDLRNVDKSTAHVCPLHSLINLKSPIYVFFFQSYKKASSERRSQSIMRSSTLLA